jgi:hypothetical protein
MTRRRQNSGRSKGTRAGKRQPPPDWKPNLSQYSDQRILRFASEEDLDAAIDLLWTEPLRTLPHATPDGKALIIPSEAVPYFARAGLKFSEKRFAENSQRPLKSTP